MFEYSEGPLRDVPNQPPREVPSTADRTSSGRHFRRLRDVIIVNIFSIGIKYILKTFNIGKIIDLINTHKSKSRGHFNKFIGSFFVKDPLRVKTFL